MFDVPDVAISPLYLQLEVGRFVEWIFELG